MKPTTGIVLLAIALVLLLAFHLHDEAHRYDVVLAGAGSGGSQESTGSTEITAYLVDHKTGKVWNLSTGRLPVLILPCSRYAPNAIETDRGCEQRETKPGGSQ